MLDEVAGREERLERGVEETAAPPKDIFNEIDFGSYFQEYLDPGYRTQPEYEENEKPSFENFLSQPTTLSDHLAWQLGALSLDATARGGRVRGRQSGRGRLSGGERRRAGRGVQRGARRMRRPGNGHVPDAGRSARSDPARHRSGAASRSRRAWARATCASAWRFRSRRSSKSLAICTAKPAEEPDDGPDAIRTAASAPRPKPRSRSGGAPWKWRR